MFSHGRSYYQNCLRLAILDKYYCQDQISYAAEKNFDKCTFHYRYILHDKLLD